MSEYNALEGWNVPIINEPIYSSILDLITRKCVTYLMTIESNISSTPARVLLANTGGIERTRDAFATLNSLPLAFDLPLSFFLFLSFLCFFNGSGGSGATACFRFFWTVSVFWDMAGQAG